MGERGGERGGRETHLSFYRGTTSNGEYCREHRQRLHRALWREREGGRGRGERERWEREGEREEGERHT